MNTRIHRIKSFAYANAKLANTNITMDMVDQCFPEAHIKASVFLHQYLSGRSSVSKPVPGQWYEFCDVRVCCVAVSKQNDVVFEHRNGSFEFFRDGDEILDDLKHLPDCTGWDWEDEPVEVKQEPPVPDFASAVGFVETTICKDDDLMWTWHCQIAMAIQDEMGSRIAHADANRCAARAMKMLFGADVEKTKHWNITVKPQPAEDPEEWVEITDPEHVLRGGVDFVRHHQGTVWVDIEASGGVKVKEYSWTERFLFRCRRKDLPAKKRTVTVSKWLVIYSTGEAAVIEQSAKPLVGVEFHRVGETTYEIQE